MSPSVSSHRLFSLTLAVLLLTSSIPSLSIAQLVPGQVKTPTGESNSGNFNNIHSGAEYDRRELSLWAAGVGLLPFQVLHWRPPSGHDIISSASKTGDASVAFVLLEDGSVYSMDLTQGGWSYPEFRTKIDPNAQAFKKIRGDALYAFSEVALYVSRDPAYSNWKIDTTGLGFNIPYDISLDTLRYVYLACSSGLYKQHPDTSIWRKVSSFPVTTATTVFSDRKNRLFAAAFGRVYMSTNSGSSWTNDTAGLSGQSVTGFRDDKFGNVYALNSNHLWRSTGGTQPWVRIDQQLAALAYDQSNTFVYNDLAGDSLLYVATAFGGYVSSDRGATWTRDPQELSAQTMYGFVKTSSGRLVTSTSLGVYYQNPADTQWTKTFPPSGFLTGCPIFNDNSGNLYTLGGKINPSNFFSLRANWNSTDGGLTWSPDTAGLGNIGSGQAPAYFADESGLQHYGAYDSPAKFYRKAPGQSWTPDTSGYGNRTGEDPTAFGTDKRGNLFVASQNLINGQGFLWRRPLAGGAWVPDTIGLSGTQIYSITADRSGNPVVGASNGVFRKSGTTWTRLPFPPGREGYAAFVVSVDSNGYTIAGFSNYTGLSTLWRGVYATKNNGATWTYLGLDSISVRGLVSYGDGTYAYNYADGIYKLQTQAGTTAIDPAQSPVQFYLQQNYPNPFNPSTTIRFEVPATTHVDLMIYDLLGRVVAKLVDEEKTPGAYTVEWIPSSLSSGLYFYRLRAGDYSAVRKLVLLK